MSSSVYTNIHNDMHEKFSNSKNNIRMKNLIDKKVYIFQYLSDKKYFIFQDKVNKIILDLLWSDDEVVFTDPFNENTKYQIIN